MPKWQIVLIVVGSACGVVTCMIGAVYFFDKYFRTRRASERDKTIERLTERVEELERKQATSQQLIDAEHRLGRIESDVKVLTEIAALREKIMANILHSGPSAKREG